MIYNYNEKYDASYWLNKACPQLRKNLDEMYPLYHTLHYVFKNYIEDPRYNGLIHIILPTLKEFLVETTHLVQCMEDWKKSCAEKTQEERIPDKEYCDEELAVYTCVECKNIFHSPDHHMPKAYVCSTCKYSNEISKYVSCQISRKPYAEKEEGYDDKKDE